MLLYLQSDFNIYGRGLIANQSINQKIRIMEKSDFISLLNHDF